MKFKGVKLKVVYFSVNADDVNAIGDLGDQVHDFRCYLKDNHCFPEPVFFTEIQTSSKKPVLDSVKELIKMNCVDTIFMSRLNLVGSSPKDIHSFLGLAVEHQVKICLTSYGDDELDTAICKLSELY